MKNITLAGVLVGLLTFTYFFIEKEDQKVRKDFEKKARITDFSKLGAVEHIHSKNFYITRTDSRYTNKEGLYLSDDKVNFLLNDLLKIKVQRRLEVSDESLFRSPDGLYIEFQFKKGRVRFELGKRVAVSDHFYMKIIEDKSQYWVEVKKEGSFSLANGRTKKTAPYLNFKELLSLKDQDFYNYLPFEKMGTLNKIVFTSVRNPRYQVDFNMKSIQPLLDKLPINQKSFEQYKESFVSLKSFFVELKKEELKDSIGSIVVNDQKSFEFFRRYGKKTGYFLQANQHVYEVNSEFYRRSLVPYQYFLNRKIEGGNLVKYPKSLGKIELKLQKLLDSDAYMISRFLPDSLDRSAMSSIELENSRGFLDQLSSETIYYDMDKGIAFHFLSKLQ